MKRRVVACAVAVLVTTAAVAQSPASAPPSAPTPKVRAEAVTLQGPSVAESFCSSAEVAVFHCATGGGKQVSVCASRDATAGAGLLQYRFGKRGQAPDIRLPARPTPPSRSASADTVTYAGGGGAWLRFRSGSHAYTVFTAIGRWGEGGQPASKEGVLVERDGRRLAFLSCRDDAVSDLGPDLFGKLGLKTASPDETFDLPP